MTNSPKSGGAREFWLCIAGEGWSEDTIEGSDGYYLNGGLYSDENYKDDMVHVIEYYAYDQALKRIEKLRAALLDLYETTKAEHGIHESEIEPWDSSSLGNAKGALADDQGEET